MFNYDEDAHNAAKFLDTLDLSDALKECVAQDITDSWGVSERLSKISEEVCEAIDNLTVDEFRMYLETKYTLTFVEKYSYEMFLQNKDADSLKREKQE